MMVRLLGDRPAALVREISKIHQQVIRGTLSELLESCGSNPFRGEDGAGGIGFRL